jgi:hypothetical protein
MNPHHIQTLEIISRYEDYLSGLKHITLMGQDLKQLANWWSDLSDQDSNNYQFQIHAYTTDPKDITYKSGMIWHVGNGLSADLTDQDLLYCNYNIAYEMDTMAAWRKCNAMLKKDGMLMVNLPYNLGINSHLGRPKVDSRISSGIYQVFTLSNMIYQLASCGFDCREAYFYLDRQAGFISAAVYKISEPSSYETIYQMQEAQVLPACLDDVILERGFYMETDLVTQWMDRSVQILSV